METKTAAHDEAPPRFAAGRRVWLREKLFRL
jgi:hypothetical protein